MKRIAVILTIASMLLALLCPAAANLPRAHADGLPGDINGDGIVNIIDLTLLKLILLGRIQPNGNSDIDGNGTLNNLDPDALLELMFGTSSSSHGGGSGRGGGGGHPGPSATPCCTPTPTPTPTVTPTATPTPSPSPSPTPTPTLTPTPTPTPDSTSDLDVSDWWLYQIYYNSGDGIENTTYQIDNVREVGATASVLYSPLDNPGAGFTDYSYSPCAIIDWNVDEYMSTCITPARERKVATGMTGFMVPTSEFSSLLDNEEYVSPDDATQRIDANQLAYVSTHTLCDFCDGDLPTDMLYSYQDAAIPATASYTPGTDDGYPFIVGESDWPQWLWQDAQNIYIGSPLDGEAQKGYLWHVESFNSGYDVDANCQAPAATGIFDTAYIYVTNTYWRTYTVGSATGGVRTPDADKVEIWYSDEVQNFVRKLDEITYYGQEDWGIVNYESKDFGRSNFSVSDQSGDIDATITITNTLDYAADFNILLLIMDMDAATPDCMNGNHSIYLNGKTVSPDMHDINSINSAIQNTGTLNPGDSIRLTWTNVYTSDGGPYKVWCSGEQTSWSSTPTPNPSDLDVSDWWLYQIYYDSEDGIENTTYQIDNVRTVDQTATVNYSALDWPGAGFTSYTYSPCAIIDWNVDEYMTDCTHPARERKINSGFSCFLCPTFFKMTALDTEVYVAADDPTLWIDVNQMPRAFNTTLEMGDADLPSDQMYSFQDAAVPATTSHEPGADDGYPFIMGESDWPQWMWQDAKGTYLSSSYDSEQEWGYLWHVSSLNTSYDVDVSCQAPAAVGVFDVTYLYFTNTYRRVCSTATTPVFIVTPDPDKVEIWYSDEVQNFVRKLDKITYRGQEDWGIVSYESKDFGRSNFSVTDTSGAIDVSITITNILDYATDFNILLLIMDMDAATPNCTGGNHSIYLNGKTVFPDMHDINSINSAIQNAGTLNPGESVTLNWTDVYTSDGGPYTVWCSGEQTSW